MAYAMSYGGKRKMFLGGAMAVGQLALSGIQALKSAQDAKNANRATRLANIRSEHNSDAASLKGYNTMGSNRSIFKKGGKSKTKVNKTGLAKVPKSNNIYKVVGPKHEQGGVDIAKDVEVEGGEYVKVDNKGVRVLSDDNSFATIPADSFENKVGTKSPDATFNEEFVKQEASKGGKVNKKGEYAIGDFIPKRRLKGIGTPNLTQELDTKTLAVDKPTFDINAVNKPVNSFDNAAPYIANVANIVGTLAKPKVPKPIYGKAVSLDTEVNVNPQIAAIERSVTDIKRGARGSFATPGTTTAIEQRADTVATERTNLLLGEKEAKETELRNREAMINVGVDAENRQLANTYRQRVSQRSQEQIGELSENIANVQDNIVHKQNMDKMATYQDKQLLVELATDVEGKNAPKIMMGAFDTVLKQGMDVDNSPYDERTKKALRERKTTLGLQ